MIKAISLLLTLVAGFLVVSLFFIFYEATLGLLHIDLFLLGGAFTMLVFFIVSEKLYNPIHKFVINEFSKN